MFYLSEVREFVFLENENLKVILLVNLHKGLSKPYV